MLKRTNPSPAAPLSDTQKHTRAAAFACDTPAPSECGSTGSHHLKQKKRRYPQGHLWCSHQLTSANISMTAREQLGITDEQGQISMKHPYHYSSTYKNTKRELIFHVNGAIFCPSLLLITNLGSTAEFHRQQERPDGGRFQETAGMRYWTLGPSVCDWNRDPAG